MATFATTTLATGAHSITAEYGGDGNFNGSASSALAQTVNAANSTTTLASSLNPSYFNDPVTFTATVTASATGTITFKDSTTTLGTGTLTAGQATFTTSSLAVSNHTISAVYSGDGNFNASTSGNLIQTVRTARVTAALGGTSISADKASNGVAAAFTTLGNIVITEAVTNDFPVQTSTTLILSAPSGWRFNPGVGTATRSNTELTVNSTTVTATNLTINISVTGITQINALTISNIQVRALDGGNLPAAGNILRASANPGTAGMTGITVNATSFAALSQTNGALRMYVVLPGQTFTDATNLTASGITGSPISQTAGTLFNITQLVAADREFNIAGTYTNAQTIAYSGPGGVPSYTTNVAFNAGQSTTTLATTLTKAETTTITATDGTVPGVASSNFVVTAGAFVDLQLLVPGETAAPGTLTGKTGTPTNQFYAVPFNVTVRAVDANWNLVNTITDAVEFSSTDGAATLPTPASLVAGTNTFSVTLRTLGGQTLTATDQADAGKTDTSPSITVNSANTTTTLASSLNPSTFGNSVTFTATVSQVSATGTITFNDGVTALATVAVSGGQATFTTSTLAAGNHTMTAAYSGDGTYTPSTSTNFTQTVNKAGTSSTVGSSQNPSTFGESVTFTAAVTPASATGTVTFKDGATTLGTGALDGFGQATFATAALSVSNHLITAVYGGDTNYNTSTSGNLTQTVVKADTTTALGSTVNPTVFGQPAIFTATVSAVAPGAGTPAGTVSFKDGTNTLGSATLNSGQAVYTNSSLSVASHPITAVYASSASFNGSTSPSLDQIVNKANTTNIVTCSATNSVFGQPVTITATVTAVAPGNGTRTGTVTFSVDGTNQAPVTVNGAGQATLTTNALAVGTHTIGAAYSGDGSFNISTADNFTQTVNPASSATTVSSSLNPSTFGVSVTFTATVSAVSPGAGTPTGTVTFNIDGSDQSPVSLTAGLGTFTTAALSVTNHTITAAYSGDGNFNAITSTNFIQTVNRAGSTTVVTSSQNPSVFGDSVTITATVTGTNGTPTGTVIFKDGGTALATNALSAGQATFATSAFTATNHVLSAVYSGDITYNTSTSANFTQTVNRASSATDIAATPNPSVFGQGVTVTATVTSTGGLPTGTVTFKDGAATLGTGTLTSGVASLTTNSLTAGSHTMTAVYNGDNNFLTSTSTNYAQTVNKSDTTTALASSATPSVFGQPVVFTATVNAVAPGAGTRTGTVTFSIDGTNQAPVNVSAAGQAVLTNSSLSIATHTVGATYNGDANFSNSVASVLTQIVNQASTVTTISSSVNPSVFGQSVTFTGTVSVVSPGAGTPTGTLAFTVDGVPQTPVTISAGIGTVLVSGLSTGAHTIAAAYSGDASFTGSSNTFAQTVNKANTTTGVASSTNPSFSGDPVTFTATVNAAAPGAGTPTGSVIFRDGGTALFTNTLSGGQASFTTAALSVASHTMTVVYNGDSNFNSNTSTNFTQTVNAGRVTAATGGTNISADKATNGVAAAATALGNIVITEQANGDFADTAGAAKTLILSAPGGWRFGAGTGTVSFVVGQNITAASISVSATTITVSVTVSQANKMDTLTISNIQVQATEGGNLPAAGNILRTTANPGTETITGITLDTTSFGALSQTVGALRLYTVLPGQAFTDTNTVTGSGITGTAVDQTAGNSFNVALVAADRQYNIASTYGGAKTISYSGPGGTPSYTTNAGFSAGLSTNTLATTLMKAETTTITATDGAVAGIASSSFKVIAGAFAKLQLLVPGETAVPGSATGKTGSPLPQTFAVSFTSTVNAVDANWNPVTNVTDTVRITSTDTAATLPADAALVAGTLTFPVTFNTVGTATLTATNVTNGSIASDTSPLITVNKQPSTSVVASSANPSVFGQSVTFTATASGSVGTPTGTATFKDGATIIGSGTLDGSGQTSFTTNGLAVAAHPITVVYGGDSNYLGSTSAVVTQNVNKASTTASVGSAPNPSVFGEAVTLTATINATAPGAGTPAGTVTFKDGATALGTGTLTSGQASFITSSLTTGTHTNITATYNGDANFLTSISAAYTQTVNKANTTTGLTSSVNPSVFGQPVVYTATVNAVLPGAGTRTGTVTFSFDGVSPTAVAINASGVAVLTNSSLSVSNHTISAVYSGDANFNGSPASDLAQVVNKAGTTTTVSSSGNPSLFGASVTFTGTVSVVSPGNGTRTGTLTFNIDGTDQTPSVAINAAGIGTLAVSGLSTGAHLVAATYSGDDSFIGSGTSTNFVQTVNKGTTTATVASSLNPSVFGQSVTFTATVTQAAGAVVPTGTVTFKDGVTTLGTGALDGAGQTTFATASLTASNHVITVAYGGDGNYNISTSANLTQTVNKATSATDLATAPNPSVFGQAVTLTATISVTAPGAGTPTGTVSFKDGATTLGTGTLSGNQATFLTSSLSATNHLLSAVYNGDSSFTTSTSTNVTQIVNKADSTTTLSSSGTISVFGQSVTFTAVVAAVSPGVGTPTGSVIFMDGATTLGTNTLTGGQAIFSTAALSVNSHSITAVYTGDTGFNTNTSAALAQTVNKADTTITPASAPNPSQFGQTVTFTATVNPVAPGTGTRTGTVTFTLDGNPQAPVSLSASNQATFSTSSLNVGNHTVTTAYSGDGNFNGSSDGVFTQTVTAASVTTALSSSANPSYFGDPVRFTATLSTNAATGTMQFKIDGANFGSAVTLSGGSAVSDFTNSLTVGTHTIAAVYSGDGNYAGNTSSNFTQTVSAARITAATGGTNISADKATNGVAAAFTTLGNIVITEQDNADFPSQTATTLILTAPSGWRFNAGTGSVSFAGGANISAASIAVSSSNLTVTLTVSGVNKIDTLTISNIQVQATEGGNLPVAGNILRTSANQGTAVIAGITPNATSFGALSQGIGALRLFTVLPGQTFTDSNTVAASGITGTVPDQTAGSAFNVALVAADREFNISTNYSGAKTISYSGPGGTPSYTTNAGFSAGLSTNTLITTLVKAETTTITATDGTVAGIASSSLKVNAAAFTKLQLLVPGELTAPGTTTGKTNSPTARSVGGLFNVTVNAVDANWNLTTNASDVVRTMSSDATAGLPADTALAAGTQVFNVTFNTAGSQTLTATNISNGAILANTSPLIAVNPTNTTTTVASALNPSVFGQTVTFTATVVQVAGTVTPTGTVTFKDGAATLGTGALDGLGQTTFMTASLSASNHVITALYGGDGNYNTSTSGNLTQTVNRAGTATSVVSAPNPSVFGESVTLTATVTSGAGTPTGTVTFKDDTTTLGTGTLVSGQATFATSALATGSHTSITATYNGDASFDTSVSAAYTHTVNKANTTTTLASAFNPSVFGQSVTFTATVSAVSPGAGTRTGTVTFTIDSGTPTNVSVNASGQAILANASLSVGGHTISAAYNGDGNFNGSPASPLAHTVNKSDSSTVVSSSLNPSGFSVSVTFTATVGAVSPGTGTPSGTVTFSVDGTPQAPVSLSSGQATFTTSSLSSTNHTISAAYSGDGNFNFSSSTNFIQIVTHENTTTTVSSSPNPSVFGQSVTLTATVANHLFGPITGGVTFFLDGATTLGTGTVVSGVATIVTSGLSVSNHVLSAAYSGDSNYNPSTSTNYTHVVNRASSASIVASSFNPSVFGQSVTLTGIVTAVAPGAGTPTGTVTFKDGAATLATRTLTNGLATFATTALAVGSHTNVTLTYSGDASFTNSISGAFTQTVNKADATATVASSFNPTVFGQSVTFTATVAAVAPGSGTPSGNVTFNIDGVPQTTTNLNGSGVSTFSTSSLSVSNHTVTATYGGSSNFNGIVSGDFTQLVIQASTTTKVASSLNPSVFGQSVTFTATVSVVAPGVGTRTGNVTFFVDSVSQTAVSVNAAGLATWAVSGLSTGLHTVAVTYSGDGNFTGSNSTNINQTVNRANSTASVASSVNPSVFGQSVTFTATVNPVSPGAGTPTGTVTFKDSATTLGTGTLSAGQATFAISSLSVSNHLISVVYNGDAGFNTATSTNFTQTVNKANTTTALASSANPACFGQAVTFTATVNPTAPGAGTPSGTVTFKDGATTLGSPTLTNGLATFTTSSLSATNHPITATFNGISNFNSSVSLTLTQKINALPTCSITGTGSLCAGSTGNFTGPSGVSGYSWSLTGNGTISGGTSGQSVSVNADGVGSFTLFLTVTGVGGCTSTCSKPVTINTPPSVTTNPTNRTVCVGSSVSFTAAATASLTPTLQWQVSTNGGATFANISGATSSPYTFTSSLSQNGNQYRAVFTNACGTATSTPATLTVIALPTTTITAASSVCASSAGNTASVPNAGVGASYAWSITGGTITAGNGTPTITYTAGTGGMTLSVSVTNASGCVASGSTTVTIPSPSQNLEGWRNATPVGWQGSTFNNGDHQYGDGSSLPMRLELKQLCPGGSWCVVLQYDFQDANTPRHFYDFLTTYNASENTVIGQECASFTCSGVPTTYPIPTDTNLTYQLPGMFTVYNGTITNVSGYTTLLNNSTTNRQLIITGTTDAGSSAKDVLILFGGHLARENEWKAGNGAHDFPGASAKVYYKFCGDASFGNFSVNPGSLIVQSDLGITKADSPDPACPGSTLTYSLNVTNTGPDQATGVTVTDPLPRGTTLVSATPSQGTVSGTTNLTFSLGTLNAVSNATITIVVNVASTATGILTNTAVVSAASPVDLYTANNTATAITTLRTSPGCLITGPGSVCLGATTNFAALAGMTAYSWSITGNGSISGVTTAQTVTATATGAGSFTLSVTVTDTNGCTSTCQQTVNVINTGAPLIICAEDKLLQCGESTATNNTGAATASSGCGGGAATITFVDVATPANCTGRAGIDRVWTATNTGGQSSICTQHIVFVDSTAPTFTACAGNQVVNTAPGSCIASNVSLGTPSVSDNCTAVTITNNAPATYPKGVTPVIWTATDGCGNSATCTQTVTVIDNQAPTITCPAAVTNNADAGHCYATGIGLGTPATGDNCTGLTITNDAPAQFPVGNTTVHWTVLDAGGNSNGCSQIVTIRDLELPTIIFTNSVVTNALIGSCITSNINLGTPVTADNCGIASVSSNPPTVYLVGTTNVLWTVTDIHGNSATGTQLVTVVDDQLPTIICPANVTTNAGAGFCSLTGVVLGTPFTSDNCGVASVTSNAPDTFVAGATLVVWTVTDVHGNANSCTQTVTVLDIEPPQMSCPNDVSATADAGHCYATGVALGTPATFDNCGAVSVTNNAPAQFPVGTTFVAWTATDGGGNSATCTQTVTVTDIELPVITCPSNVTVTADAGQCYASGVALGTPFTSDNCGVASVSSNAPAQFPAGPTVVTWTVVDIHGNTNTCTQLVTVTSHDPPHITCPPTVTTNAPAARCSVTARSVYLGTATYTGGIGSVTIVNSATGEFLVGTNYVVWTATDSCGSSSTCTQIVVVLNHHEPYFDGVQSITPAVEGATLTWDEAILGEMTYNVYVGTASGAEDFNTPVATTNDLSAFVGSLNPGTTYPITYYFVVRATDSCGVPEFNTVELSVQPLLDPNKDQDGDGLPNGYEQDHGLNPFNPTDGLQDVDGDGQSLGTEYRAGTDPYNSASYLGITAIAKEGNNLRVTWMCGAGRTNVLQVARGRANGSYSNNFTDLSSPIILPGAPSLITTNYLDIGGATNKPALYYRIHLLP